ncbi:MAG: OmpH family outer membrane protein [Treponema sp.]|nr:OmpH family outer membrane protein [Treponema sp.]
MKKFFVLIVLSCCAAALSAQQLTRFAVVDILKVYAAFFRDSIAVKEFEERSAKIQSDIDAMTSELLELRSQYADAVMQGDQVLALKLDKDINEKTEFRKEYYSIKTAELEEQRKKLMQSGSFLDQIQRAIRYIAESEGYVMVLNLNENNNVLWYSPTIDITDKLIRYLLSSQR